MSSRSSSFLVTEESIARELWFLGLRGREHVNAFVERIHRQQHRGVLIEHDGFWDAVASQHAERFPHDHDAELKQRCFMYQGTFKAETHELLDPSKVDDFALVHRRKYVFETGRWGRFVRDAFPTVERRVRRKLLARGVSEGRLDELTQDVTGEAWVRACSSIGSFDPRVGTLDGWFEGVLSKTVSLALRRERKKSRFLDPSGDGSVVFDEEDRCKRGLDEYVLRKLSNEKFEREVLPLLRKRMPRLVERTLNDEPIKGNDHRDWKQHRPWMKTTCESRGWTSSS